MCYICGGSRNKIIHNMDCRYVKMIPEKNRRYFNNPKDIAEAGYVRCKYCAYIMKYLRKEKKEIERFCRMASITILIMLMGRSM